MLGGIKNQKNDEITTKNFSFEEYTNELEEKIERFLLNVEGIKNVEVIVTLNSSGEQVYGENNGSLSLLGSSDNKNQNVLIETYPDVRGVAIACTGGSSDEIRNRITRLISAYLGISTNRIEIISFG